MNEIHKKYCSSIYSSQTAFTIVELLVVIVVIAILAAITIVSYTGISQRATVSALQSDLANNSNLLKMYYTDNGHYPPSPLGGNNCTNDPRYCLKTSNGNTLEYISSGATTYKLTAFDASNSNKYYITDNGSPNNKNVLNLALGDNASFENGIVGGWIPTRHTSTTVSTDAYHGTRSYKITVTEVGGARNIRAEYNALALCSLNEYYTASVYLKAANVSALGKQYRIRMYGESSGTVDGNTITLTMDSWQRSFVSKLWVAGDITTRKVIVENVNTSAIGDEILVDAVQLELGSTATPF